MQPDIVIGLMHPDKTDLGAALFAPLVNFPAVHGWSFKKASAFKFEMKQPGNWVRNSDEQTPMLVYDYFYSL
jgi:hypothetical protein